MAGASLSTLPTVPTAPAVPTLRSLRRRRAIASAAVAALGAALAALALGSVAQAAPVTGVDRRVNDLAGDGSAAGYTQSNASVLSFGGQLLVAYNDSGSLLGGARNFTGWARSVDGGSSFADLGRLPLAAGDGEAGNPTLARDAHSGAVYLAAYGWNNGSINVFRSADGGASFTTPVNAASGGGSTPYGTPRLVVDNADGAGQGTLYVAAHAVDARGPRLFRSTDAGASFTPLGAALGVGHHVTLVVQPDHGLVASWYDPDDGSIVVRRSADRGETFGTAVRAVPAEAIRASGAFGDLGLTGQRAGSASRAAFAAYSAPQLVSNPVTGQLLLAYAGNPDGADAADVFLVSSDDQGATWSAPRRINTDATSRDQWQPSIAITPDGRHVGIFWYDRRGDAGNNRIAYRGRICDASGFDLDCAAEDFAVSDVDFLPAFGEDSGIAGWYMGLFDSIAADEQGFAVAWGDNRDTLPSGRNDPNVYFDRIALSPAPPTVSSAGSHWLALAGGALLAGARRPRRRG